MPANRASNEPAPALVLDTNVVLDWLLFGDPGTTALAAAVTGGAVRWLCCTPMRDEFERTLGYRTLQAWNPDRERLLSVFDRHAAIVPAPATLPVMRCSDPDDQVFLDLAVAGGARWLLTHDRALLRLRRRAAALGLEVMAPGRWTL